MNNLVILSHMEKKDGTVHLYIISLYM